MCPVRSVTYLSGRSILSLHANTMIRSGNSTRFTPQEVRELRQVGLDLSNVKCQTDLDAELTRWACTLADERFDLLEQIATEMAKAKGLKMPPKLSVAK
jgi:hypothetical protein